MIKLTRKGWNNVLIFASLFMILIFNGAHQTLMGDSDEVGDNLTLFPAEQILLTLDMPGYSIERIGKAWRANPEQTHSDKALALAIKHWLITEVEVVDEAVLANLEHGQYADYVITAWFAGWERGYVLQLYKTQQYVLVFDRQREVWLSLQYNQLASLLLEE